MCGRGQSGRSVPTSAGSALALHSAQHCLGAASDCHCHEYCYESQHLLLLVALGLALVHALVSRLWQRSQASPLAAMADTDEGTGVGKAAVSLAAVVAHRH